MTISRQQPLLILLAKLAAELKQQSLWQTQQPSETSLASNAPFCCDTLRFEQWLQFILIKRLTTMIENNSVLPDNIALCSMAEQAFASLGINATKLINIIADIDELLSGKRLQTFFVRSS